MTELWIFIFSIIGGILLISLIIGFLLCLLSKGNDDDFQVALWFSRTFKRVNIIGKILLMVFLFLPVLSFSTGFMLASFLMILVTLGK
jgi:hypothetical protein